MTPDQTDYFKLRDLVADTLRKHDYTDACFEDLADHVLGELTRHGYSVVVMPAGGPTPAA